MYNEVDVQQIDRNNSFFVNFGLFIYISYNADDIATDVSIMLPISPIIITEFDNASRLIPVL